MLQNMPCEDLKLFMYSHLYSFLPLNFSSIPLYPNKSPYNTSENTPRRLRPLPAKQLQKLQPKPSPQLITEQLAHSISFKENQIPDHDNVNGNMKSAKRFEQEINNRNQFLKLCEKNRFYKNPNFSEPWKVFSM